MKTSLTTLLIIPVLASTQAARADDLDDSLASERADQTGTAITIIFDNSGSMAKGGKINQAKSAFTKWISALPATYALALIDFHRGQGRLAVPLGKDRHKLVSAHVAKALPSGKTPIASCLQIAAAEIQKRRSEHSPYERHVIVVFTDGAETVHKLGNKAVVSTIARLRQGTVEVVGIGFHGEGDYMKGAATNYFHATNEKELVAGLSEVDAEISGDGEIEISAGDLALIDSSKIPVPKAPTPERAKP